MDKKVVDLINSAEDVLVGIGEAFDGRKLLETNPEYIFLHSKLLERKEEALTPALIDYCWNKKGGYIKNGLNKLKDFLADKNYYVISTATSREVRKIEWKNNYAVFPCGGADKLQCPGKCEEGLRECTQENKLKIKDYFDRLLAGENPILDLGECPKCGKKLTVNSIYHVGYDESGYLGDWGNYTKWLQGTLNHKIVLLEIGVGMMCPSVIRFPFERIATYNNKATLIRVNRKLWQLPDSLPEKGISIPENAVDWVESIE